MYTFTLPSPIGLLFVQVTSSGLRRLHMLLAGQRVDDGPVLQAPDLDGKASPAEEVVAREVESQLRQYFDGDRRDFDLPLDLDCGSAFQRRVWEVIASATAAGVASWAETQRGNASPVPANRVLATIWRRVSRRLQ